MWWTILYLIPLLICLAGCAYIIKHDKTVTRGNLFVMLLIFIPVVNILGVIGLIVAIAEDPKTKKWFNTPIIDHTKES